MEGTVMKPAPKPKGGENQNTFVSRCMSWADKEHPEMKQDQRVAMCMTAWRSVKGGTKKSMGSKVLAVYKMLKKQLASFQTTTDGDVPHFHYFDLDSKGKGRTTVTIWTEACPTLKHNEHEHNISDWKVRSAGSHIHAIDAVMKKGRVCKTPTAQIQACDDYRKVMNKKLGRSKRPTNKTTHLSKSYLTKIMSRVLKIMINPEPIVSKSYALKVLKRVAKMVEKQGRKPMPVGTISERKGGKYKKTAPGEWVKVKGEPKGKEEEAPEEMAEEVSLDQFNFAGDQDLVDNALEAGWKPDLEDAKSEAQDTLEDQVADGSLDEEVIEALMEAELEAAMEDSEYAEELLGTDMPLSSEEDIAAATEIIEPLVHDLLADMGTDEKIEVAQISVTDDEVAMELAAQAEIFLGDKESGFEEGEAPGKEGILSKDDPDYDPNRNPIDNIESALDDPDRGGEFLAFLTDKGFTGEEIANMEGEEIIAQADEFEGEEAGAPVSNKDILDQAFVLDEDYAQEQTMDAFMDNTDLFEDKLMGDTEALQDMVFGKSPEELAQIADEFGVNLNEWFTEDVGGDIKIDTGEAESEEGGVSPERKQVYDNVMNQLADTGSSAGIELGDKLEQTKELDPNDAIQVVNEILGNVEDGKYEGINVDTPFNDALLDLWTYYRDEAIEEGERRGD